MAFSCKVGSFSANTGTGSQAVTGVGFQPKAVIMWTTLQTADGTGVHAVTNFGVMVSSSLRFAPHANCEDGQTSSDSAAELNTARAIVVATPGTTTLIARADATSLDADGFTINWGVASGVAYLIGYCAIGGDDLTNVHTGTFSTLTATGDQAFTGVGFQPDCIIAFLAEGAGGGRGLSIGAATANLAQWVSMSGSEDSQATMITDRYQVADGLIAAVDASAVFIKAALTAVGSDGFTLNYSAVSGVARTGGYLALKGGQYKVGQETQKTSTGTKATTGVGFTPKGLMLSSVCNTASSSVAAHNRKSVGFASGTSARGCIWSGSTDNVADSIADHDIDTAAVIKMMTEGTPSTEAEADLSSFDGDGYTLNWVTADATARELNYLAFGDTAAPGGTVVPIFDHYYRQLRTA